jgi:hypothetical protein
LRSAQRWLSPKVPEGQEPGEPEEPGARVPAQEPVPELVVQVAELVVQAVPVPPAEVAPPPATTGAAGTTGSPADASTPDQDMKRKKQ